MIENARKIKLRKDQLKEKHLQKIGNCILD